MTLDNNDIVKEINNLLSTSKEIESSNIAKIREILEELQKENTELKAKLSKFSDNEEKLRLITEEQSIFGIVIIADNYVVYANQAMLDLCDYKREESLNLSLEKVFENIHPDDRAFMAEQFKKKMQRDKNVVNRYSFRFITQKGDLKWAAYYSEPIVYHGKTAIMGMTIDITDKKKIEDNLIESEKRYHAIFEDSPAALWEEDFSKLKTRFDELKADNVTNIRQYFKDHPDEANKCLGLIEVKDLNRAALNMLKVKDKSELLKEYDSTYWQDYASDLTEGLIAFFNGKTSYEFSSVNYNTQKEKVYVKVTAIIAKGFEFDWSKVLVSIMDQTEIIKAKMEIASHRDTLAKAVIEKKKELEIANEEILKQQKFSTLGQLTAIVSHELRNPLGTIKGSAYTLRKETPNNDSNETVNRALSRIERSIARCDAIIDDLLNFQSQRDLLLTPCNMIDVVNDVLNDYSFPDDIKIVTDLSSNGTALLDNESFKRCLVNLLDNACQSFDNIPSNSEKVVTVRAYNDNEKIHLVVADTGSGIPADNIEKIFEPLFSTKNFGVGLGLSIVKQIIENHNGSIDIQSAPEMGTNFDIALPIVESGEL